MSTLIQKNSVYSYPGFIQTFQRSRLEIIIEGVLLLHYNYTFEDLRVDSRKKELKDVRFLAMYFLKTRARLSYASIGKKFNNRHHTTVMNAVEEVKNWIESERVYRENVEKMDREILSLYVK